MKFLHHAEMGRRLAQHVVRLASVNPAVVAIVPGGVRIGWEIAQRLRAPMDVLIAEEIDLPGPGCHTLGVVVDGRFVPHLTACNRQGVDPAYAELVAAPEIKAQLRREWSLRAGSGQLDLSGRTIILVSDGTVTSGCLRAATQVLTERGAGEIIYAAPVAGGVRHELDNVSHVVTLFRPDEYRSVMLVNEENRQTTDDEIHDLLRRSRDWASPEHGIGVLV